MGRGATALVLTGWDDPDFRDAQLLHALEWRPSRWEDIQSIPARVMRLYLSYRAGQSDRTNTQPVGRWVPDSEVLGGP